MTTDRLKELLQGAVELELWTIPPYLCALYSMRPVGNQEAKLVIRSVVVEEMLHMVLAANVRNAIGGKPRVSGDHAPRYPHELPDGVVLHLLPFSPEAVDAFLKVENPEHSHRALDLDHPLLGGRRLEQHMARATDGATRPGSSGAFYHEIIRGLDEAVGEVGERALFCGDPSRQVGQKYYYAGGGAPINVTDLASAHRAPQEIVEQGEGDMRSMYDDDGDLAHYFRFAQIKHARAYLRSDDAGEPTARPSRSTTSPCFRCSPTRAARTTSIPGSGPRQTRSTGLGQNFSSRSTPASAALRTHSCRPCEPCSSSETSRLYCWPTHSRSIRDATRARRSSGMAQHQPNLEMPL